MLFRGQGRTCGDTAFSAADQLWHLLDAGVWREPLKRSVRQASSPPATSV
jgi:hypothetical protein